MCLGAVAEVVAVHGDGRVDVRTDAGNEVALALPGTDPPTPGAWVLVHTGLIADRLTAAEAQESRRIRREGRSAAS